MPSVHDCATLAEHVYARAPERVALGWSHLDGMCWMRGFAAATYTRGTECVIAFRGTETDDGEDIASDLMMVPVTQAGDGQRVVDALFRQYDPDRHSAAGAVAPLLVERYLQRSSVRHRVRTYANSIPRGQVTDALRYLDQCSRKPTFVVGHSLGGALAQIVAQERPVTAIAFNSPNMGDLRGMRPATSMRIAQINAAGDPLSIATRAVGNLSHGRVITVVTPPPMMERVATAVSPLRRVLSLRHLLMHELTTLVYIGKLAGYYHKIGPLREALAKQPRFNVPLEDKLENLGPTAH